MTSLSIRLQAALLFGLFLIGTLGVPLADAAMFHLAGRDPCAGITHVEEHGGMHHADRCTLAQPAAEQRAALGSAEAVRAALPQAERPGLPDAATPLDLESTSLQHSRAPPA